jgi:CrcB protein
MSTFINYLLIGLGGALGSVGRYWFSGLVTARYGDNFPLGILIINVTGSFAIGFFGTLTGTSGRWMVEPRYRDFFMSGICGGYTTFSAFSWQTLGLAQSGQWGKASANVGLSIALCLFGVWLGHTLAAWINQGNREL